MGDDPEAPNYDKEKKLIRSLFTGSRGPMLRKATGLDWAGDRLVPTLYNMFASRGLRWQACACISKHLMMCAFHSIPVDRCFQTTAVGDFGDLERGALW